MRFSWDEFGMAVADVVSLRSLCHRGQAGALILDESRRTVATGYNGPPQKLHMPGSCKYACPRAMKSDDEVTASYDDCVSIHAEANALLFADRRDYVGGTMYVSTSVCWDCGKLIANSGLHRVVMRVDAPHRQPERVTALLKQCDVWVQAWTG
jgi:dCMP deaminase